MSCFELSNQEQEQDAQEEDCGGTLEGNGCAGSRINFHGVVTTGSGESIVKEGGPGTGFAKSMNLVTVNESTSNGLICTAMMRDLLCTVECARPCFLHPLAQEGCWEYVA